ncbi:DUF6265 family protein [Sphingomonas sp. HT-1]|uniref:DUF6265 family protein n=1 Tax=unclassified Sphingomonas TaxID=196159 RepID=UPI0002F94176|nr:MULTISPECIES: DUF6265 family protein [unclassified Sphingomonas]
MAYRWVWTLALLLAAPAQAQETDPLAWLTGYWCTAGDGGSQTCEQWAPTRGGVKLATAQTVRGGKSGFVEFLSISVDGQAVALEVLSPGGGPAGTFRAVRHAPQGVTFENPAHDYPQRIHYWREGDILHAEIMKLDGSKPSRWDYRLRRP